MFMTTTGNGSGNVKNDVSTMPLGTGIVQYMPNLRYESVGGDSILRHSMGYPM